MVVAAMSLFGFIQQNRMQNGAYLFAFDDAWIHLQYAKNIAAYGSFSFFKNVESSSGSTSPLYTILLAVLWHLSANKIILSNIAGCAGLCLGGWFFFKLAKLFFPDQQILALGGTALMLFEPHLQFIAVSGMETTLFIALLLMMWYFYLVRRPILFGFSGGLSVWCRPEAVIFLCILLGFSIYKRYILKEKIQCNPTASLSKERQFLWSTLIICVFVAAYCLFNYLLSKTLLPNTFAAKGKYYESLTLIFLKWAWEFVYEDTSLLVLLSAFAGIVVLVFSLKHRRSLDLLPALIWILVLNMAYWFYLPRVYQNGRYLMPSLPFIILLALEGIHRFMMMVQRIERRKLSIVLENGLVVLILCGGLWTEIRAIPRYRNYVSDSSHYTLQRQIRTAVWIKDNLPADAVIAAHDVGALGYYSERKIIDMVGLITPAAIPYIHEKNRLLAWLYKEHVTYIATFRDWCDIDRRNPVFQTNELFPQIMEIFALDSLPDFVNPAPCTSMNTDIADLMGQGNYERAKVLATSAVIQFPQSSRSWALLSIIYNAFGKYDTGQAVLHVARFLNPSGYFIIYADGVSSFYRGHGSDAIDTLKKAIRMNPHFPLPFLYLAFAETEMKHDTLQSEIYREQFDSLFVAANQFSGRQIH
jgi:tetratricopeptide (TPR) repeat protein